MWYVVCLCVCGVLCICDICGVLVCVVYVVYCVCVCMWYICRVCSYFTLLLHYSKALICFSTDMSRKLVLTHWLWCYNTSISTQPACPMKTQVILSHFRTFSFNPWKGNNVLTFPHIIIWNIFHLLRKEFVILCYSVEL